MTLTHKLPHSILIHVEKAQLRIYRKSIDQKKRIWSSILFFTAIFFIQLFLSFKMVEYVFFQKYLHIIYFILIISGVICSISIIILFVINLSIEKNKIQNNKIFLIVQSFNNCLNYEYNYKVILSEYTFLIKNEIIYNKLIININAVIFILNIISLLTTSILFFMLLN